MLKVGSELGSEVGRVVRLRGRNYPAAAGQIQPTPTVYHIWASQSVYGMTCADMIG